MLIFFDFEFSNNSKDPKKRTYNDLIQVGYVTEEGTSDSFYVLPNHPIPLRIKKLLNLKENTFHDAVTLDEAIRRIWEIAEENTCISYGNYDAFALKKNLIYVEDPEVKKKLKKFSKKLKPYGYKNNFSFSLYDIAYLYQIPMKEKRIHSAFCDAIILKSVYEKAEIEKKKLKKEEEKKLNSFTKMKRNMGGLKNQFLQLTTIHNYSKEDCICFLSSIEDESSVKLSTYEKQKQNRKDLS